MKRINIIKNENIAFTSGDKENEAADAWLQKHLSQQTFGHPDIYEKQPILVTPAVYETQSFLVQEAVVAEQEVLDQQGNSFEPPQFQTVEVQPAQYEDRQVLIQDAVYEMEQYEVTPAVLAEDNMTVIEPAVIGERIKLIDVLVSPKEYEVVEEDVTVEFNKKKFIEEKRAKGRKAKEACDAVLELIGGFNIDRELTFEQKNQMKSIFSNAKEALADGQPSYAKYFIEQITPDGILVTQEMKDLCIDLLIDY